MVRVRGRVTTKRAKEKTKSVYIEHRQEIYKLTDFCWQNCPLSGGFAAEFCCLQPQHAHTFFLDSTVGWGFHKKKFSRLKTSRHAPLPSYRAYDRDEIIGVLRTSAYYPNFDGILTGSYTP